MTDNNGIVELLFVNQRKSKISILFQIISKIICAAEAMARPVINCNAELF